MKSEIKSGVLVVYLTGHMLGYSDVDTVLEWLKGYFRTGIKQVVINMSDVVMLNSSGLGKLVQWITKYRVAGGKIVFCNVTLHTKKLINLTKLDEMFEVFDTEDAAVVYLTELRKKK